MSVSARYWRLLATDDAWYTAIGVNYLVAYTISGFESTDGTGTDVFEGCTAYASTERRSDTAASYAVDGDDATAWASETHQAERQWWSVDLGSAMDIRSLYVLTGVNKTTGNAVWAKEFVVQASSDNSTWTDIATLESENIAAHTWQDIQSGVSAGIARPLIDGMGHSRFIDSRLLIR